MAAHASAVLASSATGVVDNHSLGPNGGSACEGRSSSQCEERSACCRWANDGCRSDITKRACPLGTVARATPMVMAANTPRLDRDLLWGTNASLSRSRRQNPTCDACAQNGRVAERRCCQNANCRDQGILCWWAGAGTCSIVPCIVDVCGCSDSSSTGFVTSGTTEALSCSQLASYCSHSTFGDDITCACPESCQRVGCGSPTTPAPTSPPTTAPPTREQGTVCLRFVL